LQPLLLSSCPLFVLFVVVPLLHHSRNCSGTAWPRSGIDGPSRWPGLPGGRARASPCWPFSLSKTGAVMPIAQSAQVHPTAIVAPGADIGDNVRVGPFVLIEGPVQIGAGCVIRPRAHLVGPLTLGRDNVVFSNAVLGEQPQHLHYQGEPTRLEIGDGNVFR